MAHLHHPINGILHAQTLQSDPIVNELSLPLNPAAPNFALSSANLTFGDGFLDFGDIGRRGVLIRDFLMGFASMPGVISEGGKRLEGKDRNLLNTIFISV
jgi:hypothetical protein